MIEKKLFVKTVNQMILKYEGIIDRTVSYTKMGNFKDCPFCINYDYETIGCSNCPMTAPYKIMGCLTHKTIPRYTDPDNYLIQSTIRLDFWRTIKSKIHNYPQQIEKAELTTLFAKIDSDIAMFYDL